MAVAPLADGPVVAGHLADLAAEPGLATRRAELDDLGAALAATDPSGLDRWTDIDLVGAFARPESVAATTRTEEEHPAWSWLEAVLGALVFVPLILTWYGLTRASSAYEALTGADPKMAARPFLQLWQSGFEGHLTGAFTFGHVAMSATVAIVVLFTLVLVHGLRRSNVGRREESARRRADDLLARLVPVLVRAQLVLNEHRTASPQRFTAELTGAASTLTRLGNRAARTNKDLAAAAALVEASVKGAEARLAKVDTSVRPLEHAADRIADAVRDNGKSVEGAINGNVTQVRQALQDVRDVNGELRDRLTAAGDRVEDSVTGLAASQRSFTSGIEVASDISAQILARLGEVAEESARAVATSQAAARALAEQTGALREAALRFGDLADSLRATQGAARPTPAPAPPASAPVPAQHDPYGRGPQPDPQDPQGVRLEKAEAYPYGPAGGNGEERLPVGYVPQAPVEAPLDAPAGGAGRRWWDGLRWRGGPR